jgi:hypothetical protein
MFVSDKTMAAIKAIPNPATLKPGTILPIIIKRSALTTRVNNPNVRIFIGSVKSIIMGFTNRVNKPHTIEITNNVCQPLIVKPGTK